MATQIWRFNSDEYNKLYTQNEIENNTVLWNESNKFTKSRLLT